MYVESEKSWYTPSYLQSRNRDVDKETKHTDTKGEVGIGDELGDWGLHIYTTLYKMYTVYRMDN